MSTRLVVLVALVAVSVPASATPRSLTVQQAYDEICGGPHALPLEVAGSRHFVTVTLKGPKGTEQVRFHVDTGGNTPGLMLPKSVATRLGFDNEAALPATLHIGSEDVAIPAGASWLIVDDVSPAGAKEAEFIRQTRKNFSVGQLGAGFLSRFLVCIDPANGRLGLADPRAITIAPAKAGPAQWIPLIMQGAGVNGALYPFAFVQVGKAGFGVLIDTGATTSMLEQSLVEGRLREHPDWPSATGAAGDADMHGGLRVIRMLRADGVKLTFPERALAAIKVDHAPVIDLDPVLFEEQPNGTFENMFGSIRYTGGAHGAIANDVLNRYRMLFDYSSFKLWLEPTGRPLDPSASQVRIGVALRFDTDGCPEITRITDRNAAKTLEALRVGDVLTTIDGHDACKAWHHEIAAWLAGAAGTTKRLGIRRGKAVLTIDAPVADLLARP